MYYEYSERVSSLANHRIMAIDRGEKEKVLNDRTQILKFNSMIRNENERMNKYVERILLQAKLDRREVHLKKVPVNLNVLVDEAVEHFRLQVEEKGGVIRAELDPEGYVISADEVHMLNVVCNLIDNAIKYSEESVQIKISSSASSNGYTHISVKDNGMGIPLKEQGKIYITRSNSIIKRTQLQAFFKFFVFFSTIVRDTIISCPHPVHFNLKSAPTRNICHSVLPHGCFFLSWTISPTS